MMTFVIDEIAEIGGKTNSYTRKQYLLKNINDVSKLPKSGIKGTIDNNDNMNINEPCAFGSTAIVCTGTSTDVYILTPDNEWTIM